MTCQKKKHVNELNPSLQEFVKGNQLAQQGFVLWNVAFLSCQACWVISIIDRRHIKIRIQACI